MLNFKLNKKLKKIIALILIIVMIIPGFVLVSPSAFAAVRNWKKVQSATANTVVTIYEKTDTVSKDDKFVITANNDSTHVLNSSFSTVTVSAANAAGATQYKDSEGNAYSAAGAYFLNSDELAACVLTYNGTAVQNLSTGKYLSRGSGSAISASSTSKTMTPGANTLKTSDKTAYYLTYSSSAFSFNTSTSSKINFYVKKNVYVDTPAIYAAMTNSGKQVRVSAITGPELYKYFSFYTKTGLEGAEVAISADDENISFTSERIATEDGAYLVTFFYNSVELGQAIAISESETGKQKEYTDEPSATSGDSWVQLQDETLGDSITIFEYTSEPMEAGVNYLIGSAESASVNNVLSTSTSGSTFTRHAAGATGYYNEKGIAYTASQPYFVYDDASMANCIYTRTSASKIQNVTDTSKYIYRSSSTLKISSSSTAFTYAADQIYVKGSTSTYYMYYSGTSFAFSKTNTSKVYLYKEVTLYPKTESDSEGYAALSLKEPSYTIYTDTDFDIDDIFEDVQVLYRASENAVTSVEAWDSEHVSYSWSKELDTSKTGSYILTVCYDGVVIGNISVKVESAGLSEGEVRINKKVTDKNYLLQTGVSKVELLVDAAPPYYQKNVDVVFICDVSNSMCWKIGTSEDTNTKSEQKLGMMEDAISGFSDIVLQNTIGSGMANNNTVSMCTFGGTSDVPTKTVLTGETNADTVDTTVHNINIISGYKISFDGSTPTTTNPGSTDYDKAFTQGKTLVTSLKSKYKSETGVDYDSTDRKLMIIFVTDGAPQTYNSKTRGTNQSEWYNYIAANSHTGATELYNNYGVDEMDVLGIDLNNGGFTVSGETWVFSKSDGYAIDTVLENLVSGQKLTVLFADTANEVAEALAQETETVVKLGSGVFVEDKLGENFSLQMASTVSTLTDDITLSEYSITPSLAFMKYPTWHLSDVLTGECSAEMVGVRKDNATPVVVEEITFSANGTQAYSSVKGAGVNILEDGVICGEQIIFNTNSTAKTVNGVTVDAKCFYWNIGSLSEDELVLSYYVYLDGSTTEVTDAGTYNTNEYASISYLAETQEIEQQTFPVPHIDWQGASLKPDTVVVDYGLPVAITLTDNDALLGGYVTAIGTGVANGTLLNDVAYDVSRITGSDTVVNMQHGTAQYDTVEDKLIYTATDMEMDDAETIYYEYYSSTGKYYYSTVTIVPAQNIYYEESFMTFNNGQSGLAWTTPENCLAIDALQAEDRPDKNFSEIDEDNVYGYDEAYNSDVATYSMGTAKVATVTVGSFGKEPTASFTFNGTGFDLFSVTDAKSGCAWVQIKNNETNETVTRIIDAYYGYAYGRLFADSKGEATFEKTSNPLYQVPGKNAVRLEPSYLKTGENSNTAVSDVRYFSTNSSPSDIETTTTVTYYDVNSTEDVPVYTTTPTYYDANGNITTTITDEPAYAYAYAYAYGWLTTNDASDALYQVPLLRERDFEYANYTVTIIPRYAARFDEDGDGEFCFYVDGVRIYDPCGTVDDIKTKNKTIVEEAYKADDEWNTQYIELRKNVIDASNSFFTTGELSGQTEAHYALYIDGFSTLEADSEDENSTAIEKFTEAGPNNELYLAVNQALVFKLVVDDPEFKPITTLQLGMKVVHEGNDKAYGEITIVSNTPRERIETHTISVNGSSPMFRDFTNYVGWIKTATGWETAVPLVLVNTSDTVVALTDIKWGYDADVESDVLLNAPMMTFSIGLDAVSYATSILNEYVFCEPEDIDLGEITAVWNSTDFKKGAQATLTFTTPDDIVMLQIGDIEITEFTQNSNGTRTWTYTVTVTENSSTDTYNVVFTDEHGNVNNSYEIGPIVVKEDITEDTEKTEHSEIELAVEGFKNVLEKLTVILNQIKNLFSMITGWWK